MTVEILDPRTDPRPADWPDFQTRQRLYPIWDYLLMGIEAGAASNPTLLALARVDRSIVAALAMTLCTRVGVRWLEVHQPWLTGFPGFVFAEHLDPVARKETLHTMARSACRYAGVRCAGLLYRYLTPEDRSLLAGLARQAMGTAILDNEFSTVDDWTLSLAPKRRYRIRGQVRKIAADPDIVVRFEPARHDLDGAELATLMHRHRATFGKQRFDSRDPVAAEYLHALVRRPDVHTLSYQDGTGRLLAFAIVLDHPIEPVYQHWAALPRDDGGRQHLYFDSYHRLVRHMVEGNRKSLNAGRGMLDIKQSLGFTVRPRWVVAVPRPVV